MPELADLDLPALPGMRAALASRDIAAVYKVLNRYGIAQRQIAAATGQSQSEVSEILKGRQVMAYDVLVRICEGLGIPRELMGLSFGAYAEDSSALQPGGEDEEDVIRRHVSRHAAMMLLDRGKTNDALKLVQMAEVRLIEARRDDPRVASLRNWLAMLSALAQAQMSPAGADTAAVRSAMARARDGWSPPSPHARADFDLTTSMVYFHTRRIDTAEMMASAAVQTFAAGSDRREGTLADIHLARLHVISGEPDAARLASHAVEGVIPTRSAVARAALTPLAAELEARRRPDFAELAHHARQVGSAKA